MSKDCFYQTKTNSILDYCSEGLSHCGGKNLSQMKLQYGEEVVIMSTMDAFDQQMDSHRKAPFIIDEERFFEMLEVLPPVKWRRHGTEESFQLSERLIGNIAMHFIRIGDQYLEMHDNMAMSHADLVASASITLQSMQRKDPSCDLQCTADHNEKTACPA